MIAFYPGSFDPVTRGHLDIIRRAMAFCPKLVIGVGNSDKKKALFTATERADMIRASLPEILSAQDIARIDVQSYEGATVHMAAKIGATLMIRGLRGAADYAMEEKMAIVNRRLSPGVDSVFLFTDNALRDVSSSVVKEMAYAKIDPASFDHYLTPPVRDALLKRMATI